MTNPGIAARLLEEVEMFSHGARSVSEIQASIEAHGLAMEGLGEPWARTVRDAVNALELVVHTVPKTEQRQAASPVIQRLRDELVGLVGPPGGGRERPGT